MAFARLWTLTPRPAASLVPVASSPTGPARTSWRRLDFGYGIPYSIGPGGISRIGRMRVHGMWARSLTALTRSGSFDPKHVEPPPLGREEDRGDVSNLLPVTLELRTRDHQFLLVMTELIEGSTAEIALDPVQSHRAHTPQLGKGPRAKPGASQNLCFEQIIPWAPSQHRERGFGGHRAQLIGHRPRSRPGGSVR